MDNPFRQPEPDTQRSNGFLASLQFIDGILQWLASLVQLTEKEQEDAGIYLATRQVIPFSLYSNK